MLANKGLGATTVASTMIIAAMAGIRVFATGGIGGVHRGAQETFDISTDLQEFAQTPVAVVCAGAKSILDIGLTLEYLETQGVPVIGYQTEELPAFYTREWLQGGLPPREPGGDRAGAAPQVGAGAGGWRRGGQPDPDPVCHAQGRHRCRHCPGTARGGRAGSEGQGVHPFLLARVCELTGGNSLAANIQLVLNNAALGARIAASL